MDISQLSKHHVLLPLSEILSMSPTFSCTTTALLSSRFGSGSS